jgi:hypothetical protein
LCLNHPERRNAISGNNNIITAPPWLHLKNFVRGICV